jgi:hypothetical protein
LETERLLEPWNYLLEQILTLQVRTRFTIGELPALARPGLMNRASGLHFLIAQEDAGTVVPDPECILSFDKSFPNLSIGDFEMAGDTVYIGRIQVESRTLEPVAAVTGATVAVRRVESFAAVVGHRCIMHDVFDPV